MHLLSNLPAKCSNGPHWRWIKAGALSSLLVIFILFSIATYEDTRSAYSMPPDKDLSAFFTEKSKVCGSNVDDSRLEESQLIYFVTPTYGRPQQIPELTRLSHTLMLVPGLHWIVADDSEECSTTLTDLLDRTGLPYTHLASPMPTYFRKYQTQPKGVSGRRAALAWLRSELNSSRGRHGVLYFGDDDNTFDLRLFPELRKTKKVSVFPVGLVGFFGLSSPVVDKGKVVGFVDSWPETRKFIVDMAGFAVSTRFLVERPKANMPYLPGHEEDRFLQSLQITMNDLEPLANNCTEVLVWHTKTMEKEKGLVKHPAQFAVWDTNLAALYEVVRFSGIADVALH